MLKRKCLMAWAIAGCTMFALVGCNDVADVHDNEDGKNDTEAELTTEDITLTYYHFGQNEAVAYLAEEFEDAHPNITVNVIYEEEATYQEKLLEYQRKGEMPDVFTFAECDSVLKNGMLADISEYFDADEETRLLLDTITECDIGCYGTDVRWAVPVSISPDIFYVDRQVAAELEQDLPKQWWKWEEMLSFIKGCTVYDHPNGIYFGLSNANDLEEYYENAKNQTAVGALGFDGTCFHLQAWRVGEEQRCDLRIAGYLAPIQGTSDMENWTGDADTWCGDVGRVAVLVESIESFQKFQQDVVPYPIPMVEEAKADMPQKTLAQMVFAGVSTTCEYPREAYELLKFMSYGTEGWNARIQMYHDKTDMIVDSIPSTKNETVWNAYIDMYCAEMDAEHRTLWESYFASCRLPIPNGEVSIAGYTALREEYLDKLDLHGLVDLDTMLEVSTEEPEAMANAYHAKAMLDYFGENGYNILEKEAIALYEGMLLE